MLGTKRFVVYQDAVSSAEKGGRGRAGDAKGAGIMIRNALSNITNSGRGGGGFGKQQQQQAKEGPYKQQQHPTARRAKNFFSSHSQRDDAAEGLPPPAPPVPGRSPKRDEGPTLVDVPSQVCDEAWLGSIFPNSATSSARSSFISSPRGTADTVSDQSEGEEEQGEKEHLDRGKIEVLPDILASASSAQPGGRHAAPEGYEGYQDGTQLQVPEHSWWECDYCGLAFTTFDDASCHEAGCTLNLDHAAAIPSGKCLSPITECVHDTRIDYASPASAAASPASAAASPASAAASPASAAASPASLQKPSSTPMTPTVLSRTLFGSLGNQSLVQRGAAPPNPSPVSGEGSKQDGNFELTATLCFAEQNSPASTNTLLASPAAPTLAERDARELCGGEAPLLDARHATDYAAPRWGDGSACLVQELHIARSEAERMRADYKRAEAEQMRHIERLQGALMTANQALLETNAKLQVQSLQESTVLERVQVGDRKNAQLTSELADKDEALDNAKLKIAAEQKRHSAAASELNSHIRTLAHEVERQRGRADLAEEALAREKQVSNRLQELVIQARAALPKNAQRNRSSSPSHTACPSRPSPPRHRQQHHHHHHHQQQQQQHHQQQTEWAPLMAPVMSSSRSSSRSLSPVHQERGLSPGPSSSHASSSPASSPRRAGLSPWSSPHASPHLFVYSQPQFVSPPPAQLTAAIINSSFSAPHHRPAHASPRSFPPQQNSAWSHHLTRDMVAASSRSPVAPVLMRFEPEWQIRAGPVYKPAPLPRPAASADERGGISSLRLAR